MDDKPTPGPGQAKRHIADGSYAVALLMALSSVAISLNWLIGKVI
jgi:hypothetical protein